MFLQQLSPLQYPGPVCSNPRQAQICPGPSRTPAANPPPHPPFPLLPTCLQTMEPCLFCSSFTYCLETLLYQILPSDFKERLFLFFSFLFQFLKVLLTNQSPLQEFTSTPSLALSLFILNILFIEFFFPKLYIALFTLFNYSLEVVLTITWILLQYGMKES